MKSEEKRTKAFYIDIEKVISDKNPRLLKLLPGFLIRYLKKIIHQDELNEFLKLYGDLAGLDFIHEGLKYMEINYEVKGLENLPKEGRFLFASNHPLGGLDGLVFIHEVGKIWPRLKFPVNDLLMNIKNLDPVFLPINKHGKQDKQAVIQIEKSYASDDQILYFPAGLCSRKKKGKIEDLEWKKHFITKAVKHKRNIVPVHFTGRNSNFFYNLANLRVLLGIKSNIEMVYLANEMFKQKNKKIIVRFGEPISYKMFDKTLSPQAWALKVKKIVYSLGEGKDISLNTVS
ncbi:MAG: 1-acyl-sn-glycerol-3-phosphate acyltransferase [Bacteroidales bacterium]|nr:1-acyl-sn-glycerol-3-phosphate acyltransferase [Bacteroidales bacterium]